ncbi:MAG: hypothetical protein E7617_04590 [Ruminococcaceae bacterium]|nr:hypothetical protein [Oscillospiraceae bacterium]
MKHLSRKITLLLLIVSLFLLCLSMMGCVYRGYMGEHPELCSIAWSNIPTLRGYISNGEALYDADVSVLDTDVFGRVLFGYSESNYNDREYYVLIMQYTESEKAYYYPDDCFAAIRLESHGSKPDINHDRITNLKKRNDWGIPIDESKCEATDIVRKKPDGKLSPNDILFEGIVSEYIENSEIYIHPKNGSLVHRFSFVSADAYGREIYTVYTNYTEYTDKTETMYSCIFLVVLNPDESYDPEGVILMEDPTDPAEDMRAVRALNGWNSEFKPG